jgi:glutathione S-transferase
MAGVSADHSTRIVLYRCRTPTNVLCPCGTVARRLGKLGLEYRTKRVPYKKAARPEIEELTRQRRVPVLVDGDEVVHDSRRIVQYLDWKYPEESHRPASPQKQRDSKASRARRGRRRRARKAAGSTD